MREIITVQLGQRANFLCTHFWNVQEAYQSPDSPSLSLIDHDVLFRPGRAQDGTESFLPRTLIYDAANNFGSLAATHAFGSSEHVSDSDQVAWDGPLNRISTPAHPPPSAYVRSLADSSVPIRPTVDTTQFFADFATTYFLPRSLHPIATQRPQQTSATTSAHLTLPDAQSSSQAASFDAGRALFDARDQHASVQDSEFRPWLEECDSLQAVQLFASSDDAWAGFVASYVESLRDELGKCSLWVWGLDGSVGGVGGIYDGNDSAARRRNRMINSAQAVTQLASSASLHVPLSIPRVLPESISLTRHSLWHTSALLTAAVESLTLPCRMQSPSEQQVSIGDWDDLLVARGVRRIAGLSLSPSQASASEVMEDIDSRTPAFAGGRRDPRVRATHGEPLATLDVDLLPTPLPFGSTANGRKLQTTNASLAEVYTSRAAETDREGFELTVTREIGQLPSYRRQTPIAFPLLPTFPSIFVDYTSNTPAIPMQAQLSTQSNIATWLRSLQAGVQAGGGRGDLAREEQEALIGELASLAEEYVDGWEGSDGSDEDA